MAKPNYSFEKRRKELERKSKKQQKAERKLEKRDPESADQAPSAADVPGLLPAIEGSEAIQQKSADN